MNEHGALNFPGTRAPHFSLPRTTYESVGLSDLAGHPAVLVFYPGDWEPVSRQQLALYQECLPELQLFDAALIGISVDSIWSHAAFARALDLTFPLQADFHPKGAISRAYRVYQEEKGYGRRALFVLDAEGIVSWSHNYPTNLDPGIDGILTALERMQAQECQA
ncbi:MAG TPA: redoxin domain-containing protein [Chloroflexota bacterium]